MHTPLLVFEFLGTTELMVIAVVALILFGPRKLPEIGRSVGRSLAEFKRASDDFKRTWEYEVEIDQRRPASEDATHTLPTPASSDTAALPAAEDAADSHPRPDEFAPTVARGAASDSDPDEGAWELATGRAHSSTTGEHGSAQDADSPSRREGEDEVNAS
jgi:sec-independent protein translocase protein TatA